MEIYPGIYQIKLPLPDNPLGFVNAYLLKTERGSLLIDAGWNSDEAFDALSHQLTAAGVSFSDLKYLVVTHLHPDHFGLVGRIQQNSDVQVILHIAESHLLADTANNSRGMLGELDRRLDANGVPAEIGQRMHQMLSFAATDFSNSFEPDWVIRGRESLELGDFSLEFLWTPGHSPGNLVVYESKQRLLFSGDHVLPDTTPNISMYLESARNPLAAYLDSLSEIAALDVTLVLPAHGEPFSDLSKRVGELEAHHDRRLDQMLGIFSDTPKTAYQVASEVPWSLQNVTWQDFQPMQQLFALTETVAHLDLLVKRERLCKKIKDKKIWYMKMIEKEGVWNY